MSPPLTPSDHARMLIELLQPATPELARRWLAALLLVPAEEREVVVRAVEAKIAIAYGGRAASAGASSGVDVPQAFDVVHPPTQREGFVEQVITTYEREPDSKAEAAGMAKRGKRPKRGGAAG